MEKLQELEMPFQTNTIGKFTHIYDIFFAFKLKIV